MKYKSLLKLFFLGFCCAVLATSCTKEGPMGPAGADGTNGTNGEDGQDGNVTCLVCHTTANMTAVKEQYATSTHASGNATARSASNSCAPCHSHEGFLEMLTTGNDTTFAGFAHPTVMNCKTCHEGHVSFDFETDGQDYALRTVEPVNLMLYADPTKVIDYENNSNLCVNCHQPRNSYPVPGSNGETTVTVTSSRYGPHHGPQGTLVEGIGCWEPQGTTAYPGTKSATHRNAGACVLCHMSEYDNGEGGHTWNPSLESCTACHSSATNFDVNGFQTEIEELFTQLHNKLLEKGAITSSGSRVSGTYPLNVGGAMWNYATILEDRSNGVHNPKYIRAVLKNTLESLN